MNMRRNTKHRRHDMGIFVDGGDKWKIIDAFHLTVQ